MKISIKDSAFETPSSHPIYRTWYAMIHRCNMPSNPNYRFYGGRGIKVCDSWLSFDNFVKDMYPTYIQGYSIDRQDHNGNYEPTNCEWITRSENSKKDVSQGVNKYTLNGKYLESFQAASDANLSLGLKFNHGGLNRAILEKKPFKGFRWFRLDSSRDLVTEEMDGIIIKTNVPIAQLNKDTLEIIKVWSNAKEIVDTLKINNGSLSRVCSGKLNQTGGYKWKHVIDPNYSN